MVPGRIRDHMNPKLLDSLIVIVSILIFIICLMIFPAILPGAYASIIAIALFIILLSAAGYFYVDVSK